MGQRMEKERGDLEGSREGKDMDGSTVSSKKKPLVSSVTHVPSWMMGFASAVLG